MAVVAPVFFLIVFIFIEFSRFAMAQHAIAGVAREGVRRAALATTTDNGEVTTWMREQLRPVIAESMNSQTVQVTIQPASLQEIPSGTDVTATISVDFAQISWLPPIFLGNVTIQATATVQRE